jgi:hypothetical protein
MLYKICLVNVRKFLKKIFVLIGDMDLMDWYVPELRTRNSYRWRCDYVVGARSNRGSLCAPVKQSLRKEGEVVPRGWIAQSMVFVVSELNRRTLSIDKK